MAVHVTYYGCRNTGVQQFGAETRCLDIPGAAEHCPSLVHSMYIRPCNAGLVAHAHDQCFLSRKRYQAHAISLLMCAHPCLFRPVDEVLFLLLSRVSDSYAFLRHHTYF